MAIDRGTWQYDSEVTVKVPEDVQVDVLDAQGSAVQTETDDDLRLNRRTIQTEIEVLVTPNGTAADLGAKVMVTVSANGKTLAKRVAKIGQTITVRANIPTSAR